MSCRRGHHEKFLTKKTFAASSSKEAIRQDAEDDGKYTAVSTFSHHAPVMQISRMMRISGGARIPLSHRGSEKRLDRF